MSAPAKTQIHDRKSRTTTCRRSRRDESKTIRRSVFACPADDPRQARGAEQGTQAATVAARRRVGRMLPARSPASGADADAPSPLQATIDIIAIRQPDLSCVTVYRAETLSGCAEVTTDHARSRHPARGDQKVTIAARCRRRGGAKAFPIPKKGFGCWYGWKYGGVGCV